MSAKLLATDETLLKVNANLERLAGFVGAMAASDMAAAIADLINSMRSFRPDLLRIS